jgi:hypothetical protein
MVMRRLKIVAVCVLGACALSSFAASGASAALPELGRCVKVATAGTGEFTRGSCIGVSKKHVGEYEWVSGPGAAPAFKGLTSALKLETTTGIKIGCSNAQLDGEWTGAKTAKVTKITIQGCIYANLYACYTNPLEPGTIESENALALELGNIPGGRNEAVNPWVGLDLKSENALMPIVSFQCGEGGGTLFIKLEGSVIGRLTKTNLMSTGFGVAYKQTAGKQEPLAFKGGAEDVLKMITQPVGPGTKEEQTGLAGTDAISNSEALEVKAKI